MLPIRKVGLLIPEVPRDSAGRRLVLALVVVGALALAASWGWVRALEGHLLRQEVQEEAWRWADFLRQRVPNLEALLAGEFESAEDRKVLDFALAAGELLRYKLFSADGTVVLASRNADLGSTNRRPYFRERVMHGEGYAKLADERSESRFEVADAVIGEAYAPIMVADGELDERLFLGAIEVYVDMSAQARHLREETNKALAGLLALIVVIVAVVGIFVDYDLRQRRRIERALRRDRANLARAQHIAGLGSWILAGEELRCSSEALRILAIDPGGAEAAAALTERIHPEDRERVAAAFEAGLGGRDAELEHRLVLPDGEERHVCLRLEHRDGEQGARLEGTIQDISARVRAERERERLAERLRRGQRLEVLGTLAGGIAHEINTPAQYVGDNLRFLGESYRDLTPLLEALKGAVARGREAGLGAAEVGALAAAMEAADLDYQLGEVPVTVAQSLEGIERIREIVRAVAELAKPPSGCCEPVDLNAAIRDAVTATRSQWERVARIELDLDEALPPVPCRRAEINQVLLQLIANATWAIEAAGRAAPGRIRIASRAGAGCAEIRVEDDGIGIAPEARERVFDLFYTTKAPGEGTGQGLATCYAIVVQQHGGTLEVDSEPGRGALFRVTLPLARSQGHARAAPVTASAA